MRHTSIIIAAVIGLYAGTMLLIFNDCKAEHSAIGHETSQEAVSEASEAESEEVSGGTEESPEKANKHLVEGVRFYLLDETVLNHVDETETELEIEPEPETEEETEPETEAFVIPVYSCDGDVLDLEIQRYMYTVLDGYGISWFYPYMLCMAYQESSWDVNCVTGPDKGLLQYREYYWSDWAGGAGESGDILDPYTQIRVTAFWTARRLAKGETLEEVISDHYSGGGWYDSDYVEMVLAWMPKLVGLH